MTDPVIAGCSDENDVDPVPEAPCAAEFAGVAKSSMQSKHAQYLTPHERLVATRLGMARVCNDFVAVCGGSEKTASGLIDALKSTGGLLALLAVGAGAPIGAAAHYLGRGSKVRSAGERERLQRIKDYREIIARLEYGTQEGV